MDADKENFVLPTNNQKDSCMYSINLTKYITSLSAATIAFIVITAMFSQHGFVVNFFNHIAIVCYAGAVFSGLIYNGHVISCINIDNNYDVYTKSWRFVATLQTIAFGLGCISTIISICELIK